MTYLKQLRGRRRSSADTQHRLRLFVADEKVGAILVVEGKLDDVLITDAFTRNVSDCRSTPIVCNGKGGVLGLRDFLDSKYHNDTKAMFFIDRDHDDFIRINDADKRTYITDHYSIEWCVCTEKVMCSIVAKCYALSKSDPFNSTVCVRFQQLMQEAMDHSRPVMQAVVAARQNGEVLDLNNISLSKICEFSNNKLVRTSYGINNLLKSANCSKIPTSKQLSKIKSQLQKEDDRSYVRGKIGLQFFCLFFRMLNEICGSPRKTNKKGLKTIEEIGQDNFRKFIPSDWTVPDSLKEFFAHWKGRNAM